MARGLLDGLKVVEYGNMISAPYAGKLMADMGAEVIKVEDPGGGDASRQHGPFPQDIPHHEKSGLFLNLNTSKLGITLNVRVRTGREILERLLKDADIFLHNHPARQMKALGLDYASLKELNPRLVVAGVSAFGATGPYKDYKGQAINCCAFSGVSDEMGDPDREPLNLPLSISDYQAAMAATSGILLAVFYRDRSGEGQFVDIAEADVMATIQREGVWPAYFSLGKVHKRDGHRRSGHLYPHTILPCKDGHMCLIAVEGRQYKRFIEIMGNPEWSNNPKYRDRWKISEEYADEVDALLAPWLMAHTKQEIFQICLENRIPFAPVRTIDEVVNDPHLKARHFFAEIDHPEAGMLKYPGMPYQFSSTPMQVSRPAPMLGEHNELVFCDRLGYSKQDLAVMRQEGVI
ncbi:MAG: CoA transferase [Chloroflexi bacterium]|nr:CoA transferase [Chloroflexota bacterium]